MRCIVDKHYTVRRASTARWWEPANDLGDIVSLDCKFCGFQVLKRYTQMPRTSKSGLGRYNRMRAQMVKHLHERHREILALGGMT